MDEKRLEKDMPGFMLYRESALIFSMMPDDDAAKTIKALSDYYLYGELPALEGRARQIFELAKSGIDRGREAYRQSVENGRKGARIRWQGHQ